MENRGIIRIIAFVVMIILMLCAAGAASAMEIIVDEYHSPSEDLVPDMNLSETDSGNEASVAIPPMPDEPDYTGLWVGEYELQDEPETVLIITPGEEGGLYMEAVFYRMVGMETKIRAFDDRVAMFSDSGMQGSLTRGEDGSVTLIIGGGSDMYSDSVFYEYFLNRPYVFTRDGKPAEPDALLGERWANKALHMLEGCADAFLPGEQYVENDTFEFSPTGEIRSWRHTEKTDFGRRVFYVSNGSSSIDEYDRDSNKLRSISYRNGVIGTVMEYTYNADGKKTAEQYRSYSSDSIFTSRRGYEYDASGRLTTVWYQDSEGRQGIEDRREYAEDGSSRGTGWILTAKNREENTTETTYDRFGNVLHQVTRFDGKIFSDQQNEYELDTDGKILKCTEHIVYSHDGYTETVDTVTENLYTETGWKYYSRITTNGLVREEHYMRNESGAVVYQYYKDDYSDSVSVSDTEYDLGPQGGTFGYRTYQYSSGFSGGKRENQAINFDIYKGDQGTLRGLYPFPKSGSSVADIDVITVVDMEDTIRYMTRDDMGGMFHARQVSDCMYDTDIEFSLCGYPGTLRFIFGGGTSNRLQGVWWVSRDRNTTAAEIFDILGRNDVTWYNDTFPGSWNTFGIRTISGFTKKCEVVFSDVSDGEDPLFCVAFTFKWEGPEEGYVMPWETGKYHPDRAASEAGMPAATTPEPESELEPEPEPEVTDEPEPEPEPTPEITAGPEPEPEPEQEWLDNAEWTGYWMSGGDEQGEMVTTVDENGALRMKAMFMRTFDIEAELKRQDNTHCTFETEYGHYSGVVTRISDRELHFAITGGMSMEDDENEWYYLFKDRDYTFEPADYADLWYEEPADGPEDDNDWTGNWTAHGEGMTSGIRIIQGVQGNFIIQLTFSNGYMIAGELERVDSRRMDFDAEEFGAVLTLNRKHRTILMTDLGSMDEAANEALDAFHYILEFVPEGNGTGIQPTREEPTKQPDPEPAPEQPEPSLIPEVEAIPIDGKPGYGYIPVNLADSTSYIVGKDPEAYIPFRMIDGDETTCYQFSTKESKLGEAYVYFFFETCGTFDEIWIKNGFWKKSDGKDQYLRNSRVKTMTVEFSYPDGDGYRDAVSVSLKDDKKRKDWTVISLDHKTQVHAVRFRIDSIYQGTKFKNDVCISEVMFVKRTDHE